MELLCTSQNTLHRVHVEQSDWSATSPRVLSITSILCDGSLHSHTPQRRRDWNHLMNMDQKKGWKFYAFKLHYQCQIFVLAVNSRWINYPVAHFDLLINEELFMLSATRTRSDWGDVNKKWKALRMFFSRQCWPLMTSLINAANVSLGRSEGYCTTYCHQDFLFKKDICCCHMVEKPII